MSARYRFRYLSIVGPISSRYCFCYPLVGPIYHFSYSPICISAFDRTDIVSVTHCQVIYPLFIRYCFSYPAIIPVSFFRYPPNIIRPNLLAGCHYIISIKEQLFKTVSKYHHFNFASAHYQCISVYYERLPVAKGHVLDHFWASDWRSC